MNNKNNYRYKSTLKALFAFLSILIVPIYTIKFGTIESPFEYTLSNIGNFFGHNTSFVLWGIVTGICLAMYLLYTFKKLDYTNKKSRGYLIASNVFLLLTVLTPAMKDIMPFIYFIHVVNSILFPLFLIASIMLFVQYFSIRNKRFGKLAYALLLATVATPILMLFFMGLNGLVEILFFVCISIFLLILNILLDFVEIRIPVSTFVKSRKNYNKKDKSRVK